jgi:uncharacterized protein YgbK (DUF1537 family)
LTALFGNYRVMPAISSAQWAGSALPIYAATTTIDVIHLAGGGIIAHPEAPPPACAACSRAGRPRCGANHAGRICADASGVARGNRKIRRPRLMAMRSKLLLAFYGDDFTGSTDAMEALAVSGLRTVLFLSPPTPEFLRERFPDLRCVGVAGTSRAMSPAEMDAQFEPVLRELWSLDAPLTHYKVCSTFDSAPEVGSIGHVADMVRRVLNAGPTISVLAGAPPLRRYTVFGNHFAAAGDEVFRLDRHPTMSRHPVTPMHEADLRVHLSRQTQASIGLMSLPELAGDEGTVDARHARKLESKPDCCSTTAPMTRTCAGRPADLAAGSACTALRDRIFRCRVRARSALARKRRDSGGARNVSGRRAVPQLLVVSGSASPMTAAQIQWASSTASTASVRPPKSCAAPRGGDHGTGPVRTCVSSPLVGGEERGGLHRGRPGRPQHSRDPRNSGGGGEQFGEYRKDTGHGARPDRT